MATLYLGEFIVDVETIKVFFRKPLNTLEMGWFFDSGLRGLGMWEAEDSTTEDTESTEILKRGGREAGGR